MSAVRDMAGEIAHRRRLDGEVVGAADFYAAAHQAFDDFYGLTSIRRTRSEINSLIDRYSLTLDSDVRVMARRGLLTRREIGRARSRAVYAVFVKRQANRLKAALSVVLSAIRSRAARPVLPPRASVGRRAVPGPTPNDGPFCRCAYEAEIDAYARQVLGLPAKEQDGGDAGRGRAGPEVEATPKRCAHGPGPCRLLLRLVYRDLNIPGEDRPGEDDEALRLICASPADGEREAVVGLGADDLKVTGSQGGVIADAAPNLPYADTGGDESDDRRDIDDAGPESIHSEISSVLSQAGEDAESPGRETDPAAKQRGRVQ